MSIFYGSGLIRVVVLGVQHSERHTPFLSSYLFGEERAAPRKGILLPRTYEGILGCVADPVSESTLRGTAPIKIHHKSYQSAEKTVLQIIPKTKRTGKRPIRYE